MYIYIERKRERDTVYIYISYIYSITPLAGVETKS